MLGRAALLLVAWCAIASAAPLAVEPRAPADALLAQRIALGDALEFVAIEIGPALTDAAPAGTADAPVEMREVPPPATTGTRAGQWTYTLTLREREPHSVPAGRIVVELTLDGASVGLVHLAQDDANRAAREGARVAFALPAAPGPSALYAALARIDLPGTSEIVLTSAYGPSADGFVWLGDDRTINPSLTGTVHERMDLRIVHGEATNDPHNLRILDASRKVVAGPTPLIDEPGETATLAWTPERAGEHHYECAIHPSMTGTIQVNP